MTRIELSHVSFRYHKAKSQQTKSLAPCEVDHISFALESPCLSVILGQNGAGKTTLLKLMLTYLKPLEGDILLNGGDIHDLSARERAAHIAYIPQAINSHLDHTVFDTVLMGTTHTLAMWSMPNEENNKKAYEALEEIGILHLAHKKFQHLSGGEKQLVLIARALAQGSDILIMDEPSANLDLGNQHRLMTLLLQLREKGHLIIMTTHNPQQALDIADHVIMLDNGQVLAQGTTKEVLTAQNLSRLYQIPIDILMVGGREFAVPRYK